MAYELSEYKNVPGYNGKYQADIYGNIYRVYKNGKKRKLSPHKKSAKSHRNKLFVKLTHNGISKEIHVFTIMVSTFYGNVPAGKVPYHKDGCITKNEYWNIGFTDRKTLGKMTGAKSKRIPVMKISRDGEIVAVYSSAREAARHNNMSYQTILDRCHNKVKRPFELDGHNYQFDD